MSASSQRPHATKMNPFTLRFRDAKLEREFNYLRYCESKAVMVVFVWLCSGLALFRWLTFPWTKPGFIIRISHHMSLLVFRYALDRFLGLQRASRIFPWVLCIMTWIGGILFAWLHRSGTLDPMYYTPPDQERPWMEFAFAWRSHQFCNDRCKSSRTTCESWFWGCEPTDSVIGATSRARSDVSWPESNWGIRVAANPIPFSFSVMPSDVLSRFGIGKAFDAFSLMAVGMFLSSFAVRRIGMAFVPRLLSLAGVTIPFLSICSAYDHAQWTGVICALATGELLNYPLEARWRRRFLETYGAAAVPTSPMRPLSAGRWVTWVYGRNGRSVAIFALVLFSALGVTPRVFIVVCSFLLIAIGFSFFEVDLRIVNRKELQRLQQAAVEALEIGTKDAESAIASFVFHELRNDQNAIGGFLNILADELGTQGPDGGSRLSPAHRSLLHDARLHSHHATQVITNMLEMSKLRANKLTLPNEPFVVGEIARESAALVKHLLAGSAVRLLIDVEDGLPPVRGSPFHIKQVLLNLLTNACKYTEKGHIILSVARDGSHSDEYNEDGEYTGGPPLEGAVVRLRFAVQDSGCGVEPGRRSEVFAPYTQGPAVGTGLGLPLSRALVQLMGGSLELLSNDDGIKNQGGFVQRDGEWIEEATGRRHPAQTSRVFDPFSGSTFAFDIALHAAPCKAAEKAGAAAEAAAANGLAEPATLRVLVADDLAMNRIVLKHALSKALPKTAMEFSECDTGEAALELLSREPCGFDAAFLDEHFGIGLLLGTDVTRVVRERERRRASRPLLIIGCSGNAGTEELEARAKDAGQDATVGKPLPDDFKAILLGLLNTPRVAVG